MAELGLFLCGDVMTGRGIDQALPHPCDPRLYEGYVGSALGYVALAEEANGPIPRPVDFSYIWGDALPVLARAELRVVNLETAVTTSEAYEPKGINYRMNPANLPCLTAAGIDCCVLANNHVLDWGRPGLIETLDGLGAAGIAVCGAGREAAAAAAPAVLDAAGKGRVLVWGFGVGTSGIPYSWRATEERPGVNLLGDLSPATLRRIAEAVGRTRGPGDLAVASIHWGPNWGYEIPDEHRRFARGLIDEAGADIVHGHSSHHPLAVELHHGKPILYGCGDFLNDYEGISGHDAFRPDLALAYLARIEAQTRRLSGLELVPLQMRNFRLNRAAREDAAWLLATLNRESAAFATRFEPAEEGALRLVPA